MASLTNIIEELTVTAKSSVGSLLNNEAARQRILHTSRKLTRMLETPEETAFAVGFWPTHTLAVRVAIQLDLFKILASAGSEHLTADELARRCGSEALLVVRIMRPLAAYNFVEEVDVETYKATPLSHLMAQPTTAARIIIAWDQGMNCFLQLIPWLSEHNNKCPTDPRNGLLQRAFNTDLEAFEYWSHKPDVLEQFNLSMSGIRSTRPLWFSWFPVEERLLKGASEENDKVLMIDIGGGLGHDIGAFKKRFPSAKGRLVLQEMPKVIDDIKELDSSIERVKHDIFQEQPIKGARIYFSHFVLHDWSNEMALKVLKRTAAAMTPGYSKVLLNEFILPDRDCPLIKSGMDLMMLGMHGAMERSEKQWSELLDAAGLKVVKFWNGSNDGEGVLEAELKG